MRYIEERVQSLEEDFHEHLGMYDTIRLLERVQALEKRFESRIEILEGSPCDCSSVVAEASDDAPVESAEDEPKRYRVRGDELHGSSSVFASQAGTYTVVKADAYDRLKALNKNLKDANAEWDAAAGTLRQCLNEVGSDGSIYSTVFDEAVAVLKHWRAELDRLKAERDAAYSQTSYLCAAEWRDKYIAMKAERDVLREFVKACYECAVDGWSKRNGSRIGQSHAAKRCLELADAARRGE